MHDRELRRFRKLFETFWDSQKLQFEINWILLNLFESIESSWNNWISLKWLNQFKMIECILNNIQINWLQSRNKNKNNNNNFQTYRTVRVSLTVKKNTKRCQNISSSYIVNKNIWFEFSYQNYSKTSQDKKYKIIFRFDDFFF